MMRIWLSRSLLTALTALSLLTALSISPAAYAEQASRQVWVGRYGFNQQGPEDNRYTTNRDDAFNFARTRMEASMGASYGYCAPPTISFIGEVDRTAGTGLLYYGVPSWRVDYLDLSGGNCTNWSTVNTSGEIFSFVGQFETGPTEERSCSTANPVQPGSGRKRFTETDYAGAGAHPLSLTRHYSSRWTDGAAATGLAAIAAWDGGWRHAYQASLVQRSDGSLRALRPDGTMLGLTASATVANTWTASPGSGSRDTATALIDTAGQRTGYTYAAAADDSTETYDATGRLQKTVARNGWTTTLGYSDATTPTLIAPRPGLLISVKNHFGRELKFTYDAQARVAEVLPPGALSGQPAGGSTSPIRYVYGEPASLGAGVPAQSQLTSVVWQDGTVRRYHHEDGRWPQSVTGITDEAGVRYGTYAYDDQGRVTRSELAGGAERLDFAYGQDATGKPTTAVTDYTGAGGAATTRSYTFADIGGVRYPSSLTAPCSLCGSTAQATLYDASGNKTREVGHDGKVTFYAYDAKGRETERATFAANYATATTRPALGAAEKVTSTKWHATWNLPTQIAEPGKVTATTYSAKGNLTGQSWTATTDATGATKFAAVKTGSTFATGWSYNANSLATTVVNRETAAGATIATETGRWTYTYDASGGRVTETDKVTNKTSKVLASNPSGQVLEGIDADNIRYRFVRGPRGQVAEHHFGVATAKLVSATGGITNAANGFLAQYSYDGGGRLRTTQRSNAATLTFSYSTTGTVTAVTELPSAGQQTSARAVLAVLTGAAAATPAPIGGSGLFLCSRGTTILPVALGNHAYLWDAASRRCCGRDQNRDPLLNCNEAGPPTDSCTFIEGSIGKEKEIVSCCKKTANDGAWIPWKNDCHDSAERCVVRSGLKYPGAPGGRGGQCPSCWLTPDSDLPPLPPAP